MNAPVRKIPLSRLSQANEWLEPDLSILGDDLPVAPKLAKSLLPPEWQPFIETASRAKSCSPDYIAAVLIAGVGAALSGVRVFSPWTDWREPPVQWVMPVGEPSTGKSPAMDVLASVLHEIEDEWTPAFEEKQREHIEKVGHSRAIRASWDEDCRKAAKDKNPPPPIPEGAIEPQAEPVHPRCIVNDPTIEKLVLLLAGNNGRGLLLHLDEGSFWLGNFARRSGDDRPFWLQYYGARPYKLDRVKNGNAIIKVQSLAVSVAAPIQPDKLRSLISQSPDDGLYSRFLYFFPLGAPPFQEPTHSIDTALINPSFDRLTSLKAATDSQGRLAPKIVPFSDQARKFLVVWRRDKLPGLERMTSGLLKSWVGKMPGHIVRVAAAIEYLGWAADSARPEPEAISASAVDAAIEFCEQYALPMARRALAAGSQPAEAKNAAMAGQWLIENREALPDRVKLRDLYRRPGFPVTNPEALKAAASVLEGAHFWREVVPDRGSSGKGRIGHEYEISPLLTADAIDRIDEIARGPDLEAHSVNFDNLVSTEPDIERVAIQAVDGGAE